LQVAGVLAAQVELKLGRPTELTGAGVQNNIFDCEGLNLTRGKEFD
jgi:hypothetical protein